MPWSTVTKAKSDQLNADDLIGGAITIEITKVELSANKEQPAVIDYKGCAGKPWKPCKSMMRVMQLKWGDDEQKAAGRFLTIERDQTVKWAGEEVGGIRITHMSHMDSDDRFMLTASRNFKKPYKVEHLILEQNTLSQDQAAEIKVLLKKTNSDVSQFLEWVDAPSVDKIDVKNYKNAVMTLKNKLAKIQKENKTPEIHDNVKSIHSCDLCKDAGFIQEIDENGIVIDEYECSCKKRGAL